MITNRFLLLAMLLVGGVAAALTVGRHSRHLEKQQHKDDLRTWEHEGGNLAPSAATPAETV